MSGNHSGSLTYHKAIIIIIMVLLIIKHYVWKPNVRGRHMKHIHSSKLFRLPNLTSEYQYEDEKIMVLGFDLDLSLEVGYVESSKTFR